MKFSVYIVCICCIAVASADLKAQFNMILEKTGTEEIQLSPILNFSTKCFDEFGCYNNGPPFFDPVSRPISLLPSDNPSEKIKYLLYTPKNRDIKDFYNLEKTVESLQKSPYNTDTKTIIWIHGWQLDLNATDDLFRMKDALFNNGYGYNFILINWSKYVGNSYEGAAANGRVAGTAAAKLIEFISNNTKHTPADFHVIGQSLGGQVAAYVGQETPGLGMITALDAGGEYFYDCHKDVRLDPTDAIVVQAIHANGGYNGFDGLGYGAPYGTQDFYPNGGQMQPGCGHEVPEIAEEIKHNVVRMYLVACCDHGRSFDYFLGSITNHNCTMKGTMCNSYEDWKAGKCPPSENPVAIMGINAKKIPGLPPSKFYLDTQTSKPYCKPDGHINPTL